MRTKLMVLLSMPLFAASALAQTTGAGAAGAATGAGGGGGRGNQTPEQIAARQAAREAAANKPRTIDGINTVWLEELTQPEFRDKIKEGYKTVLIMTAASRTTTATSR